MISLAENVRRALRAQTLRARYEQLDYPSIYALGIPHAREIQWIDFLRPWRCEGCDLTLPWRPDRCPDCSGEMRHSGVHYAPECPEAWEFA